MATVTKKKAKGTANSRAALQADQTRDPKPAEKTHTVTKTFDKQTEVQLDFVDWEHERDFVFELLLPVFKLAECEATYDQEKARLTVHHPDWVNPEMLVASLEYFEDDLVE